MKTKIIISVICLFFISGDGGCEEEEEPKPDYITVNVDASGYVREKDSLLAPNLGTCTELCKNFQVKIKIQKDQGETFEEYQVTNELACRFQANTASFKLYRHQPIEIWVESKNDIPGYTEHRAYTNLTWDQVYPEKDFGETYSWIPIMDVYLVPE